MKPSEDQKLLDIVKATGEIYGKQISLAAALMFLIDLEAYNSDLITGALSKCRKELKSFPTVADVIARIDDGRPGVEEAWALIPKDEYGSVVWNDEIAEAYGACRRLLESDPIAARMAFKESYSKVVAERRNAGAIPTWTASLGFEKSGREAALREAISKKRLSALEAQAILPELDFSTLKIVPQLPNGPKPLLPSPFREMPK